MANKKNIPEKKKGSAAKSSRENGSGMLQACLIALGIALVTFMVMSPVLDAFFTNWDDLDYVVNNPLVASASVKYKEIFTQPVMGNYHPITMLTLAWNYAGGQFNPKGYHAENLVFHVLNTILVFFFIFLLTRRNLLMATIVSFFFGVHPMHVESVAWISERKDVLYVFFFMAGLITYLLYRDSRKRGWYVATIVLFIFSCFSKGMGVVFPLILVLVDYVSGIKLDRKSLLDKIPFFILSLAIGILVFKVQQESKAIGITTYSFFERSLFASYGAIMYLVKFLLPIYLSAVYPYPVLAKGESLPIIFYLSPFILLAIIAAVFFLLRKDKPVVFGVLFFFVTIILVLQFISVGYVMMADRYSYLSYIGLLYIVAYVINRAWQEQGTKLASLKYPLAAVIVFGGVFFCFQSYGRTQVWNNCETLWTDVIAKYPKAYLAYKNRGYYYQSMADLQNDKASKDFYNDKALRDYYTILKLNPDYEEAYNNRGNIFNSRQQYDSAMADYNKAISLDTSYAVLFANRGICYMQQGKYDKSIPDFSKAIKLNPADGGTWYNRSKAEFALGKADAAKADALKAQQLGFQVDPGYLSQLGIN